MRPLVGSLSELTGLRALSGLPAGSKEALRALLTTPTAPMPPAAAAEGPAPRPPKELLRAALPGLGLSLWSDTEEIYGSAWRRAAKILGRKPTTGELRAVLTAWIAWFTAARTANGGAGRAGTSAEVFALYRRALAAHAATTKGATS